MTRVEFMNELRALLWDLSVEEREEALQYYNDYFDDAGAENEADIIKELESPEKVAETIKAGLGGQNEFHSEYRETGYTDTRFERSDSPVKREGYRSTGRTTGEGGNMEKKPWTNKTLKIILIVLIALIVVPVAVPAAGGILVAILGILIAIVAVVAAILMSGIAVSISGIGIVIAGFTQIFHSAPVALALIGIGMLVLALGIVLTVFIGWICMKIVPPVFRWLVELCRKPFQRKKGGGC
ncbi:MAG: DUF1700 domain-containing protein [Bariatricus sp.]